MAGVTMMEARRMYRRKHGTSVPCAGCDGAGGPEEKPCELCSGKGTRFKLAGPGFRSWARKAFASERPLSPKLAKVVG